MHDQTKNMYNSTQVLHVGELLSPAIIETLPNVSTLTII